MTEERPPPYAPPKGPNDYGTTGQKPPAYNESVQPGVPGYPPNAQYAGSGYQPGYQPLHPGGPPQQQQPVRVTCSNVVLVGGCPACRVGYLEESFTLAGLLIGLFFFPLGIICCLLMKEKRCSSCGATFPA